MKMVVLYFLTSDENHHVFHHHLKCGEFLLGNFFEASKKQIQVTRKPKTNLANFFGQRAGRLGVKKNPGMKNFPWKLSNCTTLTSFRRPLKGRDWRNGNASRGWHAWSRSQATARAALFSAPSKEGGWRWLPFIYTCSPKMLQQQHLDETMMKQFYFWHIVERSRCAAGLGVVPQPLEVADAGRRPFVVWAGYRCNNLDL